MTGIKLERDNPVPMRDGLQLGANVYRPDKPGHFPVVMAFTAFGKDVFWSEKFYGWGMAYEPGSPTLTGAITFEANDPAFWVPHGYVLIIVDPRGVARSPGKMRLADVDGLVGEHGLLSQGLWARDMYDAIEWAAQQEWSNGCVGLSGVSILGFSQWRAAALNPPHLKAINPWEAMTDFYRDVMFPGGIPETKFSDPAGLRMHRRPPHNPAWPPPEAENPSAPVPKEEDEFLAEITVPALICATWSDHGCHTRGAFRAFRKISSPHKWLYIHGREKWAEFYTAEARMMRKMFFDHFLKGTDDRILRIPRVRLEVEENLEKQTVRWADDYPLPQVVQRKIYLDAADGVLKFANSAQEEKVSYDSTGGKAVFDLVFEQDAELIGHMSLKLWVSPKGTDDMDLFVTLRKFDRGNNEVYLDGWAAPGKMPIALGWLRLSHRALEEEKSTPWEPYPKHVVGRGDKVNPGDIVPCEIPVLPTGILFRRGERLRLEIAGVYRGGDGVDTAFAYTDTVNRGIHSIYTGGKYDAYLLAGFSPPGGSGTGLSD